MLHNPAVDPVRFALWTLRDEAAQRRSPPRWATRAMLRKLFLLLALSSLNAEAGFLGFGADSWNEEVLLHDGKKVIVQRSQSYGGQREVGQSAPIKQHTISFGLPDTGKKVTWTSEYGADVGRANFSLLAIHVLAGTPYIVAYPNLCLSYNKWGRPNPPYVFFKYDGKEWQRISLEQFPSEFTTFNVVISLQTHYVDRMIEIGQVSTEGVAKLNSNLSQAELKSILRDPVKRGTEGSAVNCRELIYYKGAWVGPGDSIGKRMMDRAKK